MREEALLAMGENGASMLLCLLALGHALEAAAREETPEPATAGQSVAAAAAAVTTCVAAGSSSLVVRIALADSAAAAAPSAAAEEATPRDASWADGMLLSPGATVCDAGGALLQDHMVLSGAYHASVQEALRLSDLAQQQQLGVNADAAATLAPQLLSLEEAAKGLEAALATHSAEVRALVNDALHHLLPLCALLPAGSTM